MIRNRFDTDPEFLLFSILLSFHSIELLVFRSCFIPILVRFFSIISMHFYFLNLNSRPNQIALKWHFLFTHTKLYEKKQIKFYLFCRRDRPKTSNTENSSTVPGIFNISLKAVGKGLIIWATEKWSLRYMEAQWLFKKN